MLMSVVIKLSVIRLTVIRLIVKMPSVVRLNVVAPRPALFVSKTFWAVTHSMEEKASAFVQEKNFKLSLNLPLLIKSSVTYSQHVIFFITYK